MHELFSGGPLAILPDILPKVVAEASANPSAGTFLFARRDEEAKPYRTEQGAAVIDIRGALTKRGGFWTDGYERIRERIEAALNDGAVRSILLNIDSPGGTVDGCKVLADWIASVRDEKPMYAFADGTMCSAAYWIGAATGRVFAPVSARVGSVGVVMTHTDWSKWNENFGIGVTYITGGEFKAVGNIDTPLSDKDLAYLQKSIDEAYAMFRHGVASSMALDEAEAKDWADGKVFYAEEAHELGLVTRLVASREEAIATITKENPMTRQELEAAHPDLFAEVCGSARTEGVKAGREDLTASTVALVNAFAGEEVGGRVKAALDAGLTAEQVQALGPALAAPKAAAAAPEPSGELQNGAPAPSSSAEAMILDSLTSSPAAQPVGSQGTPKALTPEQQQTALIDELAAREV